MMSVLEGRGDFAGSFYTSGSSKADIGNEKARRWGTGLIGNISRSAIGPL
jgi:hypothetical protein